MKAKGNRIQMSEWLDLVQRAGDEPDTVPPGFKTIHQIAKEIGKSYPRTSHIVRSLMEKGLAKRSSFRVQAGSRMVPVFHYKPAKNALN